MVGQTLRKNSMRFWTKHALSQTQTQINELITIKKSIHKSSQFHISYTLHIYSRSLWTLKRWTRCPDITGIHYFYTLRSQSRTFHCVLSCSRPRWDNLPSGHQRYLLFGLNLGYMYWGQKHISE